MESDSDSLIILESENEEPMDTEEPNLVIPIPSYQRNMTNFLLNTSGPIEPEDIVSSIDSHNIPNIQQDVGNQDENPILALIANREEDSRSRSPINLFVPREVLMRDYTMDDDSGSRFTVVSSTDYDNTSRSSVGSYDITTVERLSEDSQQTNTEDKRLKVNEPIVNKNEATDSKSPKRQLEEDDEDDGKTCPICLDNWTNFGEHRICALKCGHLFGLKCINHWFSLHKKKTCPTCKKKASRSDIRHIYTKKLVAVDVTELELLKDKLCVVTEEKNKISIELTKALCREHLIDQELKNLKKNLSNLQSLQNSQLSTNAPSSTDVRLYMDKSLEICKENGCRVLAVFNNSNTMVASMKSPNTLFPGFGVRKIDILSYKPTTYIPLHSKPIRDLKFHAEHPWLLSVSLDKSIKVTDVNSNSPVVVYSNGDVPLWSCCWDKNDSNMFFVGKQQGSISKYDIRQTNQAVTTHEVIGDLSPVVAVSSIRTNENGVIRSGGIAACKLNSLWVIENNVCKRHHLPIEGPFISMVYTDEHQQFLLSTRANSRVPYTRHHLCNIEMKESNLFCNTIHCFKGSSSQKYLTRSCLLNNKSNSYVAAYQESNRTVCLWSVNSGQGVCNIPARNPVMDLCGFNKGEDSYLMSLTESKLEFFKFKL